MPREFQRGTASIEQAKAWAQVELMGPGSVVVEEREITPAGRRALFLCDPANAGTGGNSYMVFDRNPAGVRYLGFIWFGGCRAVAPDSAGKPRLVTSWHMSAMESEMSLWLLTDEGFKTIKSVNIYDGDGGTVEGNRIMKELYGTKPIGEPFIEKIFGANAIAPAN